MQQQQQQPQQQQPQPRTSETFRSLAHQRVARELEQLSGQTPQISSCSEHEGCVKLTLKNTFLHVQLEREESPKPTQRTRARSCEWVEEDEQEPIVGGFVCRAGQEHKDLSRFQDVSSPGRKQGVPPPPPPAPGTPDDPDQDKRTTGRRRRRKAGEEKCKMRPHELTVRLEPVPQWYTTATFSMLLKGFGMEKHIDFLYIPPLRKGNRGFAVVNLVDVDGQFWFTNTFNNCVLPGAGQASVVTKAKVQGWENNVRYYSNCSRQQEQNKPVIRDWHGKVQA
jgi:hypothetical protein